MATARYALAVVLFITVIQSNTSEAARLRCYNCNSIDHPDNCTVVTVCPQGTICNGKKYVDLNSGQTKYNLQCIPQQHCKGITAGSGSRSGGSNDAQDIVFWESCCNSDHCNGIFDDDGKILPRVQQKTKCYKCDDVADPSMCLTTTICAAGQACVTYEKYDTTSLFELGCLAKSVCNVMGHHLPFGRRKRYENCRGCCEESINCNYKFCSHVLGKANMTALGTSLATPSRGPTSPSTTKLTTTTTSRKHTKLTTTSRKHTKLTTATTTTTIMTSRTTTNHASPTTHDPINPFGDAKLLVSPTALNLRAGSMVTFDCKFDKDLSGPIRITWYFRNATSGDIAIYHGNANPPTLTLLIYDLALTDSGTYRCEANHSHYTWNGIATLNVHGFLDITHGPESVTLKTGSSVTLNCTVSAVPVATITWEKEESGQSTPVTAGVTATRSGSQLTINSLSISSIYKCIANNSLYTREAMALVSVTEPAKIAVPPQSQSVRLNSHVILVCQATGHPQPKVTWSFASNTGSTLIPPGTAIMTNDTIDIPKMTSSHEGTWTCRAENSEGHTEAVAVLSLK